MCGPGRHVRPGWLLMTQGFVGCGGFSSLTPPSDVGGRMTVQPQLQLAVVGEVRFFRGPECESPTVNANHMVCVFSAERVSGSTQARALSEALFIPHKNPKNAGEPV